MTDADVWDSGVQARWREWQAKGARHDAQRTVAMRRVLMVIAVGLAAWALALVV